ncbi:MULTISPECIES: hypothetical protein [unclassified Streptomyces]|uniref:hypothetical protein n=1 Tax=unclassified Streptomyces TaxID=2593676 RepID=UPI000AF7D176|nr:MULTISPECIES: hypothetical protein [unclassified Streptomyces]THC54828.1 hypothetical protein E7X58_00295 [Streptomyces sp. A1499]
MERDAQFSGPDASPGRIPPPPAYPPFVPPPTGIPGWWQRRSAGAKTTILTVAGGLILASLTSPLAPTLTDIGQRLNPFQDAAHELKVVALGPYTYTTAGWILPDKEVADVDPLPGASTDGHASLSQWADWQKRVGAVSAGQQVLKLNLQGGSPKAVTLHGMDVTADCQDPIPGTHIFERGAGGLPSRHFRVILDAPGGPTVTPYGKTGEERPDPEPAEFPFYVSESELEHFVLDVQARSRSCSWRATLRWSVNGRQGTTQIGNSAAFRLTAATAVTGQYPLGGSPLPAPAD